MSLTRREQELLQLLRTYIDHLRRIQEIDPAGIEPFGEVDASAQRWLQLAIQCCLDLGDSLVAKLGKPEPSRYRDIFPELERARIIDSELTRSMVQLTGFRKALAHAYSTLSPSDTWQRIRQGLPALLTFAEKVAVQ
ncbi:MAG TPA: DUF86 domain-containing protein [Armatimonadota bacterium]|nr:DUF86 domain-containing protein [Armatimonadota bacterium]